MFSPARMPSVGTRNRTAAYAALIAVGLVMMTPLLWALSASLQSLEEVYAFPRRSWSADPQWSNFSAAVSKLPFGRFMLNSMCISTVSACGALLTSAMAGYAFARLSWRGRSFWFVVLLLSLLIPSQVLLIPRFLIFKSLGWVGTYKPLIVPAWLGGGAFNVLLFTEFFRRLGTAAEDAALIDGATPWQIFWRIHLPAARPVVVVVVMMSFVLHWQEFLDPLIYLSDFETYPVSLGLRMYQSLAGTWLNLLMAASLIALVPVALVVLLCLRLAEWRVDGVSSAPRV
ncbi:MAG: carbohydrate ABC transporter permease [Planctomycetes bacterium]|nr:carbohydrate ABC transporter permease [Planctomycetota bacterium]